MEHPVVSAGIHVAGDGGELNDGRIHRWRWSEVVSPDMADDFWRRPKLHGGREPIHVRRLGDDAFCYLLLDKEHGLRRPARELADRAKQVAGNVVWNVSGDRILSVKSGYRFGQGVERIAADKGEARLGLEPLFERASKCWIALNGNEAGNVRGSKNGPGQFSVAGADFDYRSAGARDGAGNLSENVLVS